MSKKEQKQDQDMDNNKEHRHIIVDRVDFSSRKTPEEYWKEVRETVLPEYLSLFDSTNSMVIKHILEHISTVKPEYRFTMSIYDFEDLTEKDFLDLRKYTDNIKLIPCDPGKLLLSFLKKKKIEHYSIEFKLSDQTIQNFFSKLWRTENYVIYF